MNKIFIVPIAGAYGGDIFCAVKAENKEKAEKIARMAYKSMDHKYYDPIPRSYMDRTFELVFDEDGISELFEYQW
jgi:hypothetical protein